VFRRLAQDVEGFHKFVNNTAKDNKMDPAILGAKLVGRYASGAPLELTEDEEDLVKDKKLPADFDPAKGDPAQWFPAVLGDLSENSARDNHFEYGDDTAGLTVPRAAHIRKAYPRDEQVPLQTLEDSESSTQTHRVLRRGIPFGTSFRPSLGATGHGGKFGVEEPNDRGLLFLAYQSSIERQFEFVQGAWVNNVNFPLKEDGHDPIIAQRDSPRTFTLPTGPAGQAIHLKLLEHWVTTTGGDYFFQPSIDALHLLAK
jgi:deferrochelatase/peroxidase EfeB